MSEQALSEYIHFLRKLHQLQQEGKGDSPEYDAVCDEMDGPWYAMTAEEQERARVESARLNQINRTDEES
jgi:hypothetical protein